MIFNRRHLAILVFAVIPLGKICLDCGIPMFVPIVARSQNHMARAQTMPNCESMQNMGEKLVAAGMEGINGDCRLSESPTLFTTVASLQQHIDQRVVGTLAGSIETPSITGQLALITETGPPLEAGDLLTGTIVKRE